MCVFVNIIKRMLGSRPRHRTWFRENCGKASNLLSVLIIYPEMKINRFLNFDFVVFDIHFHDNFFFLKLKKYRFFQKICWSNYTWLFIILDLKSEKYCLISATDGRPFNMNIIITSTSLGITLKLSLMILKLKWNINLAICLFS